MRKALQLSAALLALALIVSACGPLPPLKSEKYLNDNSFVTGNPCAPPCFHNIVLGQTTFTDALSKVKADPAFANVQNQDKPPSAAWSAVNGDACCQMSADPDTGIVNAVLIKTTPKTPIKDVIAKYGQPDYVTWVDYSPPEQVALGLVFKTAGLVTWVSPTDANASLQETDPIVVVLFLDPKDFNKLLDTATLQAWNGFRPYPEYKAATPVITPRITLTPQQ
jgi:hypothetical protein